MRSPICIFLPGDQVIDATSDLAALFAPDILDHKVVVISIAGRFRQGKSFLMNFIIRYLRAGGEPNWCEADSQAELSGFDWRHTQNPVTSGVLLWPEVFKVKDAAGEEIAVILMDTQGIFDINTSLKDSTSIFSLSVLLSSVQIFNVKQNIQGDDLSHLELFTEFGRLISHTNSERDLNKDQTPFQDLIFLVRDWSYPRENPFGWDGGKHVLKKVLEEGDVQRELASVRVNVKKCFETTKCFLMSHPGQKVDTSPEFRGSLSDMNPVFLENMKDFIEDIFRPSHVRTKRINGNKLTVRDFAVFVELYTRELRRGRIPTPDRLLEATVKAVNRAVVEGCYDKYLTLTSELVRNNPQKPAHFKVFHDSIITNATNIFKESTKMGDSTAIDTALKELLKRIAAVETIFEELNSVAYKKKLIEALRYASTQAAAVVGAVLLLALCAASEPRWTRS